MLLDIQTVAEAAIDPRDWVTIAGRIQELRVLKNLVFRRRLTERWLKLF